MKIAVIGSNGRSGQLIVKEAVQRGLDVTGVARKENKSLAPKFIQKDLFDLTKEDLKGFDVVIDAFAAWTEDTLELHTKSLMKLSDLLSNTQTRLIVVGGAGSLYVNSEHTLTLLETPDFPDIFKPVAIATGNSLDALRKRNDVRWTYISPPADFQAEGKRTGEYILAGEEFTLNSKGESAMSYADFAIATIDEAVKGNHIQKRISVLGK